MEAYEQVRDDMRRVSSGVARAFAVPSMLVPCPTVAIRTHRRI